MTVSIEHCDEALNNIYQKINEMIREENESDVSNHYIVLHMGVYEGSGAFNIEM